MLRTLCPGRCPTRGRCEQYVARSTDVVTCTLSNPIYCAQQQYINPYLAHLKVIQKFTYKNVGNVPYAISLDKVTFKVPLWLPVESIIANDVGWPEGGKNMLEPMNALVGEDQVSRAHVFRPSLEYRQLVFMRPKKNN